MASWSTETIWSQMSSDLRRFIRHRVSDDHVADDLLQETFVRIHRSINTLKNTECLTAWLYQLARNVIIDHYRTANRNTVALAGEVAAETNNSDSLGCRGLQWLEEIVEELPAKYSQAVRLSEIEGLTQQQVADRLGISLSGAKSRVQRGREMLKGALEQCCFFHFDRRGNILDYEPKPERRVCLDCDSSHRGTPRD